MTGASGETPSGRRALEPEPVGLVFGHKLAGLKGQLQNFLSEDRKWLGFTGFIGELKDSSFFTIC
jgi:hypothetical protein